MGKNVSSFIGFAPADDPQIIVLFIVDEPQGVTSTFGSVVAAPYVKSIMEDSLQYLGFKPAFGDGEGQKEAVEVPDVRGGSYEDAVRELARAGLSGRCSEQGGTIKNQMPQAGAWVLKGSEVLLYTNAPGEKTQEQMQPVTVPDVRNKPAEQARAQGDVGAGERPHDLCRELRGGLAAEHRETAEVDGRADWVVVAAGLWADDLLHAAGLDGMAKWMRIQAKEEEEHAMKLFDHIVERDGRALVPEVAKPKQDWKSPLEAFKEAYKHEQKVTSLIHSLVKLAGEENDYPAGIMLQWFVTEQVEEEKSAAEVVDALRMVGTQGSALFMVDRWLGDRQGH